MKSNKEMKLMEKKNENELRGIAIFSIYLMISLTVFTAYTLRIENNIQGPLDLGENLVGSNKISDILLKFMDFIIPSVSAEGGCCLKTKDGRYCVDGASQENCEKGYYGGKCSDVPNGECGKGTCVQQSGDCDARMVKSQCEENFGFFYPQTLLEIPSCTPACCIYTKDNQVVDSQWVFFKNKCEKSPLVKDGKINVNTEDITYKACKEKIPKKTNGYCTLKQTSECKYMTKEECDKQRGEFSSLRCGSCMQNKTNGEPYSKKCYNGDKGYGVYSFDSCNGPIEMLKGCGIQELCEENNGKAQCVEKKCSIDIKFTNLNYNTPYFKSGEVEIEGSFGNKKLSAPFSQTLNQGQQACVKFQGPGEQHYKVACELGELMVFGVDDNRERVCAYDPSTGMTRDKINEYKECSKCGTEKWEGKNPSSMYSKILNFLGADLINPKWWDYWAQNPGLCSTHRCESRGNGNCVSASHNDCVPKYAPDNSNICNECSTTEASSPWNKCGNNEQCVSRGNCKLSKNRLNVAAGITECAVETIVQVKFSIFVKKNIGKIPFIGSLFKSKTYDKLNKDLIESAENKGNKINGFTQFIMGMTTRATDFLYTFFGGTRINEKAIKEYNEKVKQRDDATKIINNAKKESTLNGEYNPQGGTYTATLKSGKKAVYKLSSNGELKKDGEIVKITNDNYLKNVRDYLNAKKNYESATKYITANENSVKELAKERVKIEFLKKGKSIERANKIIKEAGLEDKKVVMTKKDNTGKEVSKLKYTYTLISSPSNSKIKTGYYTLSSLSPDGTKTYYTLSNGKLLKQGEVVKLTKENKKIFNSLKAKATIAEIENAQKNAIKYSSNALKKGDSNVFSSSQYYGGLYYFPLREEKKEHQESYSKALSAWWKAQGGISGLISNQFKALGKGALVGLIMAVIGHQEVTSKLNVQYWIKEGVCRIVGSAIPLVGYEGCKKSRYIIPTLICSIETNVNGQALSNNACLPVDSNEMGVPTGYNNCEKCQGDAFPCTAQRCQALSADSSCVYDAYAQKCFPSPEKLKECDKTSGVPLEIKEINNVTVPLEKYSKEEIPYGEVSFNIEMNTNIAAECRYTLNKSAGWNGMTKMNEDRTFKKHSASLDVSNPLRKTNYYYTLCQDTCRKQIFSKIVEIKLTKADKPDVQGPVIIGKYPLPDMPIEGGLNNKREITLMIKTDEPSECKYKRWPIAESMDSFVGSIAQIEKVASNLVGAGASEQTLESELSLTGLSYNDTNLSVMSPGTGQYLLEHYVNFTGSKALNNSEIYAYVILCKDKKGNLGEIPGVVRFKVSNPFEVNIEKPEASTMEPQPAIEVHSGKDASCKYSLETKQPYTNMTSFDKSGYTFHSTSINKILSYGQHDLYVTCFDENGLNIASSKKIFNVLKDNRAPQIIRAYKDSDTIFIATNELTSCQYSIKQFNYGEGSEMTGNNPYSFEHRADWRFNSVYYLKCKDRFGNEMSSTLRTSKNSEVVI